MILRSVDGSVELCGTRMGIGIPASGDARYTLCGGSGGHLNVSWRDSPCVQEQSGRVILEVADGAGGSDELVITSPRTLEIAADGTVALTLSEYVQAAGAFPAIGAKLGELQKALAEARKELEGRPRGLGIIIPAGVDLVDMLRKHAKAYIVFEKRDGSGTKVLLKDNNALGWNGTKERSIDFDAPDTSTAVNAAKPGLQPMKCPCGGKIEFGRERVGHCLTCGASCRAMDPPPAIPDPDVREMPFERVAMAPPDTCGQSLTAALVEANQNKKLWRERAQKCQQALRRIRALTGDMSFALDEDWGADDDS